MDFQVTKRLDVDNNEGAYLEFESDDFATVWLKDGSCMAVQIQEIKDNGILVIDEGEEEVFISFEEIENIQEN